MEFLKILYNKLFNKPKQEDVDYNMKKINKLYKELEYNVNELNVLMDKIEEMENSTDESTIYKMEELHSQEFMLCIKNVGIYEDLIDTLNKTPETFENQFILKRIRTKANELLQVEIIQL